ncbi:pyridoxal phosphate-dependent aminotransferase [Variovorax sp. M-6]|uniref:pyridoxal phosphate-dependent aminotransferase n=1 Tax=Variovorax sp. M-6 TaxID=3233041 RepID=UPI003F9D2AD8
MQIEPGFPTDARAAVRALRSSKIREVANAGMGQEDVLPFWFGEPDEATPGYVRAAAIAALEASQTFYTQTLGHPRLRTGVADYLSRLHQPIATDRIAITSSGTSALMLAVQALVSPGDRVVAVTPLWPNLVEMPKVLGAEVVTVPLSFASTGWALDLQCLLDALKPGTRALLVNAPNNPTGWTLARETQQAILDHCRRHGIWIVSDDVYERICYEGPCAPSFLDIAGETDRVISCNSFSKAWLMTGWRLGWIVVPPALLADIGKLIEYSTTCAPPFVQLAGLAALEQGESTIARTVDRLRRGRDHLAARLQAIAGIELAAPSGGAMYTFFRIDGVSDSLAFCKRLVAEGGLGLAPGMAFGPEGEGFLRWCYASSTERLDEGVRRLARYLEDTRPDHRGPHGH